MARALPLLIVSRCIGAAKRIPVVVCLLSASCNYWKYNIYDVGIGLIDTRTHSLTFLRSPLTSREFVVNVSDQNSSFQTLRRMGDQFEMRTIAFDGKVLSQRTLPLFTKYPGAKYHYAVSPDNRQIVYYDSSAGDLHICDLVAQKTLKLTHKVVFEGFSVVTIHFISPEDIILILKENALHPGSGNAIVKFNIVTQVAITVAEPIYISDLDYSFSKSNRYLAYWEASQKYSLYGDIRLLDLNTSQYVGTLKNPGDVIMHSPRWSPNEQMVACVAGKSLLTAPLSGESPRVVKTLPENLWCRLLNFLNDETLLYVSGTESSPLSTLMALDIRSGKEIRYAKLPFNGDIFVADNGNRVICELGY